MISEAVNELESERKSPPFARQREPDRAKPQAKGGDLRFANLFTPSQFKRTTNGLKSCFRSSDAILLGPAGLKAVLVDINGHYRTDLSRGQSTLCDDRPLEIHTVSRAIHPDMLALFLDGKYIELRDRDKLRSACIYTIIGLGCDGKNTFSPVSSDLAAKI